jgi:hypothetical protein
MAVGGLVAGVALAPATGGTSLYAYFSALVGVSIVGIGGGAGLHSLNNYHPFDKYITKPQAQSILFDWAKKNALPKGLP